MIHEKGHIVFGKDIIKAVAKKMDLPEEKVAHVFEFLFNVHIKFLLNLPDVYSLKLPFIGTMYMKTEAVLKSAPFLLQRDRLLSREKIKRNVKKAEKFNEWFEEIQKKNPGKFIHTPHKAKRRLTNHAINKKMTFQEMEEFQNNEEV